MIIFYTSFTQGYSELHTHTQTQYLQDCRYVCFTDKHFDAPKPWEVIVLDDNVSNKNIFSRIAKINSCRYFNEGDITVYCDSQFELLLPSVKYVLEKFDENKLDFMVQSHDYRKTFCDEISFYYASGFLSFNQIKKIIKTLKTKNYDFHSYQTLLNGFIIRRVNSKVKKLEEKWWNNYISMDAIVKRDQLPLSLALDNQEINFGLISDIAIWDQQRSSQKLRDVTENIENFNVPTLSEISKIQSYITKETEIPIMGGFHFR